ncbi:MAG: S8 family serine peptidase [Fimbriimonadaceae bacterium]|nr:S8 family serine peptidase [Fimbriimonadaceae bacterium]
MRAWIGRRAPLFWVALAVSAAGAQDLQFYANGQIVSLPRCDAAVVALTGSAAATAALPQGLQQAGVNHAATRLAVLPQHQMVLVRPAVSRSRAALDTLAQEVRAVSGVIAVLPSFGAPAAPIALTAEILLDFGRALSLTERQALTADYGLEFVRPLGDYAPTGYLVRVVDPETHNPMTVARQLVEVAHARMATPNLVGGAVRHAPPPRPRGRAPLGQLFYTPNDPLYAPDQWHLNSDGTYPNTLADADVDAAEAWDLERGSGFLVIGVMDDGVDPNHEDLDVGNKLMRGYDTSTGTNDGSHKDPADAHGTAVSGVAAAAGDNNLGVTGAAPGCRIFPIRMDFNNGFSFDDVATGYTVGLQAGVSIFNNSWGYTVDLPLPDPIRQAIDLCTNTGRFGAGCVFLYSSGNDNVDIAGRGLETYQRVMAIGASNSQEVRSAYSSYGAALDLVAPSNDIIAGTAGITTTDRMGGQGYNAGNYEPTFGGTSSACPLASGVTALVISANPTLTYTEVQALLERTADQIDQPGGGYDSNGHSDLYGYGKVNAFAAVQEAQRLLGLPVQVTVDTANGAVTGARRLDSSNYAAVQYTLRGITRQQAVYDGSPATIYCDDGSDVVFPDTSSGSTTSARWWRQGQQTYTVNSTVTSLSASYYHQLRATFQVQVQAGGTYDDANLVPVGILTGGQSATVNANSQTATAFCDAGSGYSIPAAPLTQGTDQRWLAPDTDADGQPNPRTGTITTQNRTIVADFYHQARVKATLNGTNSGSRVSTVKRRYLGNDVQVIDLFGSFQDYCDVDTQLSFADASSGSPVLEAEGVHEFTVSPGLEVTVNYIVKAQGGSSLLQLSRPTAPANGQTPITVTVTVRDSAAQPVAGVAASRVQVFGAPTEGLHITNPTAATDSTGQLRFQMTKDNPGTVAISATLDGEQIAATATAEFLQVMSVSLSTPGVYLISFPISPADSRQTILDFNVTPTPPQVARLVAGQTRYEFFRPDAANAAFNIAPGKGFFLRTNSAGVAELTGTRAGNDGGANGFSLVTSPAGFHQLGNPRESRNMQWRLADFEVFLAGVSQGTLADPDNWALIDPFGWVYNGHDYEQVIDPVLPGTDGMRTQVQVYEGYFWRALRDGVGVVYRPDSGLARQAPAPVSPSNFGLALTASVDGGSSTAVVGALRQAVRSVTPPAAPSGSGPVRCEIIASDLTRAAADWQGQPVTTATRWRLAVTAAQQGPVTLSWPFLARQLPNGYRARLLDLSTGQQVLLNNSSSYVFQGSGERFFDLTVVPRGSSTLQIGTLSVQPGRGRGLAVSAAVSSEASLVLRVTSLAGRVIVETAPRTGSGVVALNWDGLDAQGRPVPRGTYQVQLLARSAAGEMVRAVRTVTIR